VEGWFKGELLMLLKQLENRKIIANYTPEVSMQSHVPGRRIQVDFKVDFGNESVLCELKSLCVSHTRTHRRLPFYFHDDHVDVIKDLKKMDMLQFPAKWLLVFVYPWPGQELWQKAVEFNSGDT
jgi:hypothetical protein